MYLNSRCDMLPKFTRCFETPGIDLDTLVALLAGWVLVSVEAGGAWPPVLVQPPGPPHDQPVHGDQQLLLPAPPHLHHHTKYFLHP